MFTAKRLFPVLNYRLAAFAAMALLTSAPAVAQELPSREYKQGTVIREAFREVVKEARQYTVQVLSQGKQVALGMIVERDGWILTKASQLDGTDLFVELATGKRYPTSLVGVYPEYDLGLLKIEETNLPVVQWNTRFDLDIGRWVATPGTGELPVAIGVIAVKPREIPLIRGLLGVTFQDAKNGGAEVTEVLEESGAEKAGILTGDIILRVSGKSIQTGPELREAVQGHRPGEGILLRVLRDDQEFDVIAILGNPMERQNTKSVMQNNWGGTLSIRRGGFTSALQHDTVMSAEECGGPLVDLSGKTIGINIARAGRTESFTLLATQITPVIAEMKAGKFAPLKIEKTLLAEQGNSSPEFPHTGGSPNLVKDNDRFEPDQRPTPPQRRPGGERRRRNY